MIYPGFPSSGDTLFRDTAAPKRPALKRPDAQNEAPKRRRPNVLLRSEWGTSRFHFLATAFEGGSPVILPSRLIFLPTGCVHYSWVCHSGSCYCEIEMVLGWRIHCIM